MCTVGSDIEYDLFMLSYVWNHGLQKQTYFRIDTWWSQKRMLIRFYLTRLEVDLDFEFEPKLKPAYSPFWHVILIQIHLIRLLIEIDHWSLIWLEHLTVKKWNGWNSDRKYLNMNDYCSCSVIDTDP